MTHQELCPLCGVIQEMDVSAFRSTSEDPSDASVPFVTIAYHCKSCGALTRYEHIEEESEVPSSM